MMEHYDKGTRKRERRWVLQVSIGILFLASVPYLFGYAAASQGFEFIGLTRNVDDASVYLSWMRQAADGHFFLRNLFTTEDQTGRGFNLLFFGLGLFSRVAHLPLIVVFHLARIAFGVALLLAVYELSGLWIKELRSRRTALLLVGLSSGLGWLFQGLQGTDRPVDLWQPEALTFLSIYLSPLFSFSMLLMAGTMYLLYRFVETGAWRYSVVAGIVLLVLANVHTYDVITLAIAWTLYCGYRLLYWRRSFRPITGGLLAGIIAFPSAAYQIYFYLSEPIFQARVAIPTLSPSIIWYILGYGLLVPLAIIGVWRAVREHWDIVLPVCWVAAGLIAVYLPVSFQRKLLMGTHIPLTIVAALGLAWIADRLSSGLRRNLPALVLALMLPSNLLFLRQDVARIAENEAHTTAHAPFISADELDALAYLRAHAKPADIVLALPDTSSLVPAYTGLTVYCGHWGETVRFSDKLRDVFNFYAIDTPDEMRRRFLARAKIKYVVGYHLESGSESGLEDLCVDRPSFLQPAFEGSDLAIYHVELD